MFIGLSGIATGLSWLCYFAAIALGDVSVMAPIDKFSVVLTMVLSFIILKERVQNIRFWAESLLRLGRLF
ncbi:EamA family transporter [Neobacillus rhizosphaerae]|uniref:EamA family transporter n=1 Tax=Neobacillus rhizosphaerae TaxID=2880965 RepID=UPI003D2BF7A0